MVVVMAKVRNQELGQLCLDDSDIDMDMDGDGDSPSRVHLSIANSSHVAAAECSRDINVVNVPKAVNDMSILGNDLPLGSTRKSKTGSSHGSYYILLLHSEMRRGQTQGYSSSFNIPVMWCPPVVSYVDIFLTGSFISLNKVGVTSLFVVAKYKEIHPPKVNEFSDITDGTYTIQRW